MKLLKKIYRWIKRHPKPAAAGTVLGGAVILTCLSFFLLPKLPAPQPGFRRTPLSSWTYAATSPQGQIESRFKATAKAAQVQVARGQSAITFATPLNQPQLDKDQEQLTFKTENNLVTIQYQLLTNGVKEDIVLAADPQTNQFSSQIVLKNLEPRLTGGQRLFFVDKQDNYQFHLQKPFAYDATGSTTYGVRYKLVPTDENDVVENSGLANGASGFENNTADLSTIELLNQIQTPSQDLATYQLVLEVDPNWLNSPERQYPITIDPTVVHDESSEFGGQHDRTADFGSGSSPSIETGYHDLAADENTVALWRLDDGVSGNGQTLTDSSRFSLDATTDDGANNTGMDCTVDGIVGGGCDFDGTDDYAVTANSFGPTQQVTMEAWVKPDSVTGTDKAVLVKENQLSIEIETDTKCINVSIYDTNGPGWNELQPTGCELAAGEWVHLAATYDGNMIRAYQNGIEVGTQDASTLTMNNTNNPYYIGNNPPYGPRYFDGVIDLVRVSNIARSAEEIKAAAQRHPSGVYTSDVIDFGSAASSIDLILWDELGVGSGDAETPISTVGLVAQWNFNATSGTTANNDAEGVSCGGTPANCDGTLTDFSNTSGQDVAVASGWTADNKRWGAGALMLDGVDDSVNIGINKLGPVLHGSSQITLSAWVKVGALPLDAGRHRLISYFIADGNTGGALSIYDDEGLIEIGGRSTTTDGFQSTSYKLHNPFEWHYVNGVLDFANDQLKIYVDGKLVKTASASFNSSTLVNAAPTTSVDAIGSDHTSYLQATVDAVSIYSRELTSTEILSNYQAGQVELQTRTSADGSTWEEWRPAGVETPIASFDQPYLYATTESGLQHYWPLNELNDNSCADSADGCDQVGSNHLESNGAAIGSGKADKARYFDGVDDTMTTSNFSIPAQGTMAFWMIPYPNSTRQRILGATDEFEIVIESGNYLSNQLGAAGSDTLDSPTILESGKLYHVVMTYNTVSAQSTIYLNGTLDYLGLKADDSPVGTQTLTLGSRTGSTEYFNGILDEVMFFDRVLTANEINSLYLEGNTQHKHGNTTSDNSIKIEGSVAKRFQTGNPTADKYSTGLYYFEETAGDGAFIKDSSFYSHHGSPNTSSSYSQAGISGRGWSFDSVNSEHISLPASTIPPGDQLTISFWSYDDTTSPQETTIIGARDSAGNKVVNIHLPWSDGTVYWDAGSSITSPSSYDYDRISKAVPHSQLTQQWNHWAFTKNATDGTMKIYLNGELWHVVSGKFYPIVAAADVTIGNYYAYASYDYEGRIDNLHISNIERTASEIEEEYRLGRDHYINLEIPTTDLSSSLIAPLAIAADKPGTYLELSLGETATANLQPDSLTYSLWRMDEMSGPGSFIADATGRGNDGSPNNTSSVDGKVGRAQSFNGTSSYIDLGNSAIGPDLQLATAMLPAVTISGWANNQSLPADGVRARILSSIVNGGSAGLLVGLLDDSGNFTVGARSYSGDTFYEASYPLGLTNEWYHFAGVVDYENKQILIYINGQLVATTPAPFTYSQYVHGIPTEPDRIGARGNNTEYFDGYIDELKVYVGARNAASIRQEFERGRRTYPITIEFGAELSSSNLVANSGDTSFTIDGTNLGMPAPGANIYTGEKIILLENYDGTEYKAQGTVSSVNESTGEVTVSSWDTASTFPSGGFTADATVFKWQREYIDLTHMMDEHIDGTNLLTIRTTNGLTGRNIWLDDLKHTTGYLSDDSGTSITSSPHRYFQYRSIITNTNPAVSPQLTSVSVDYISNVAPNTPSLDSPPDATADLHFSPDLITTATDNDNDALQYKIELCTNEAMTTGCQTFDQTSSQTGWSGQTESGGTMYTSGSSATYSIQTPLAEGTTYYWRSYAIDPDGSNTWSSTQATPHSFSTLLNAPSQCVIRENEDTDFAYDLVFEWSDDSDNEDLYHWQINYIFNSTPMSMWDDLAANSTSHIFNFSGLITELTFKVRAENGSIVSEWCETSNIIKGSWDSTESIRFEGLQMEGLQVN